MFGPMAGSARDTIDEAAKLTPATKTGLVLDSLPPYSTLGFGLVVQPKHRRSEGVSQSPAADVFCAGSREPD